MTYSVKEIYYTLQGEGARAGRPAVRQDWPGIAMTERLGLIGLPLDANSSYLAGCAGGPAAIRGALYSPSGNAANEAGFEVVHRLDMRVEPGPVRRVAPVLAVQICFGEKGVFAAGDVVLQQPVGQDHVPPHELEKVPDPDLVQVASSGRGDGHLRHQ